MNTSNQLEKRRCPTEGKAGATTLLLLGLFGCSHQAGLATTPPQQGFCRLHEEGSGVHTGGEEYQHHRAPNFKKAGF